MSSKSWPTTVPAALHFGIAAPHVDPRPAIAVASSRHAGREPTTQVILWTNGDVHVHGRLADGKEISYYLAAPPVQVLVCARHPSRRLDIFFFFF